MNFTSYKTKQSVNELKVELKVLESSLESEEMTAGDKQIIENKIIKLQGQIELNDNTVAGDIATATTNMSLCTEKEDCECGKCQLLRRKDLQEAVKDQSPFGGFYAG